MMDSGRTGVMLLANTRSATPEAAEQASSTAPGGSTVSAALSSWIDKLLFQNWPGDVFQRSTWEDLMYGFWISLALVAAGLLLAEMIARRAGYPPRRGTVKWLSVSFAALGFLSYFSFFNPSVRYADYYHRHEFFHYYLGSKYSRELGYSRLYACTAVAEVELGFGSRLQNERIRDLGSKNLTMPMTETFVFDRPEECTQHFAPERWEQFKADVAWLETTARGKYWANMKKDHGYNPPPVWTMSGKLVSTLVPANDTTFKLLASLDVLLHVAVLGLFRWAFGWRIAAIASVFWGCNAAANFYWTGGGFLRQDWIFFFIASLCFAKKRYFALSGAAFVWAGLLRVFPLAAGFGWGVLMLLYWLRHRGLHRDHKRFLAGAAVAAALLIPASVMASGASSYREFVSHIQLHNRTPLTNHMGLETMFVHDWDGRMRFTRDDQRSDPFETWKQGRLERKEQWRPVIVSCWLLIAAWTVWALHRVRHFWLGLPLSLPLVGSLTSITCYYFVMFIAFASVWRLRPSVGPAMLATAAASQVILVRTHFIDDRFAAMSWLFFVFSLLPLWAFSRPLSLPRLRSWLQTFRLQPRPPQREANLTPGPRSDAAGPVP